MAARQSHRWLNDAVFIACGNRHGVLLFGEEDDPLCHLIFFCKHAEREAGDVSRQLDVEALVEDADGHFVEIGSQLIFDENVLGGEMIQKGLGDVEQVPMTRVQERLHRRMRSFGARGGAGNQDEGDG